MNYNELKHFLKWLKMIGVTKVNQVKYLREVYELKTKIDMLDFANACAVHRKTLIEL